MCGGKGNKIYPKKLGDINTNFNLYGGKRK